MIHGEPTPAFSLDTENANFKAGHPLHGESLEDALSGDEAHEALQRTVLMLREYPNLKFEISGHTDGEECADKQCAGLALRRAVYLHRYLIDIGIDPKRLVSLTEHGSERPLTLKQEWRQSNQRAEVNFSTDP